MSLIKNHMHRVIALVTLIILTCCAGSLSQTALNAMLAEVSLDYGITTAVAQWATTIYMLLLGMVVPIVPFLMRRFSLRAIILACVSLLIVGGIVDAVAPTFEVLVAGRVLQAISAGITMPMMMSVIMIEFPVDKRATVMGIAGIAMGFSPNIGPTVGGLMVELAGWRSFFVLLALCSVVILVAVLLLVDKGETQDAQARLDVPSLMLSSVGFCALLLGFSNASSFALSNVCVWAPVIVGAIVLGWFVLRQKRIEHPLIHLDIFESWRFRAGFWSLNLLWASFMCVTLLIPLYIQDLCGGTALDSGFALISGALVAFVGNPVAGVLCDKIGARPVIAVASVLLVIGSVSMVFLDAATPFWVVVLLQGIRQAGVSSLISPLTTWSMSDLPLNHMSDGSSFSTAVRQASASLSTALVVFLVTFGATVLGDATLGYQLAFGLSGLFAVAVAAINFLKVH